MSEIKGQLLGMLLVLAVFGAIGGTLMGVFTKTSETIEKRVDSEISLVADG
ncbi:MAG: hypothetical protein PUI76_01675 [Mollicutes bacterium]|nr:hypothetical protein [bacterium]MDD6802155.1 hypothetical protein [Mollicutes bacterium]MDD7063979.1 hypothetical protein [Mollicutes bacterium]MDY2686944.1 hypothetical protein [Candidatus Enteromonas sp.]MDY5298178.1 hypothetical protein [Candidatus Enteromonas sp.]